MLIHQRRPIGGHIVTEFAHAEGHRRELLLGRRDRRDRHLSAGLFPALRAPADHGRGLGGRHVSLICSMPMSLDGHGSEETCRRSEQNDASDSITVTPVCVADLLAEGERMPVYVHIIDHPDARVRALHPELVWLAHTHEPWRPSTVYGMQGCVSSS